MEYTIFGLLYTKIKNDVAEGTKVLRKGHYLQGILTEPQYMHTKRYTGDYITVLQGTHQDKKKIYP